MPTVETSRGAIHYKDYRTEDARTTPIVLVHGAGDSHLDWAIETRRGLGAIAVDLPGHGASPPPGRKTISSYAADVVGLLDALEISQAVLAGHSMGGAIVQMLTLEMPEYVRGLVLAGTGASLPVNDMIITGIVENPRRTAEMIVKWSWARHFHEKFGSQAVEQLLKTPSAIIQNDFLACRDFDVRERLGEISVPTLILMGTADKMTPVEWGEELVSSIPEAKLVTIENGGHKFLLEQPATVTKIIQQWLDEIIEK